MRCMHLLAFMFAATSWALSVVALNDIWSLIADNTYPDPGAPSNAAIAMLFISASLGGLLMLFSFFAACLERQDKDGRSMGICLGIGYFIVMGCAAAWFVYRIDNATVVNSLCNLQPGTCDPGVLSPVDQYMISAACIYLGAVFFSFLAACVGRDEESEESEAGAEASRGGEPSAGERSTQATSAPNEAATEGAEMSAPPASGPTEAV